MVRFDWKWLVEKVNAMNQWHFAIAIHIKNIEMITMAVVASCN